MGNVFIAKKFDKCKIFLKKFDIYSKIFFRDVGNFFRHLCELVLRHQMRVSNYFVNSFYSAGKPRRNILSLMPGTVSLLSLHQENYYREYSLYRYLEHCIPFLYQLENPIKNIALYRSIPPYYTKRRMLHNILK